MKHVRIPDAERCKEHVHVPAARSHSRFGHSQQCSRKAVRDGFCNLHHPDTKKAKADARDREHNERWTRTATRYRNERIGEDVLKLVAKHVGGGAVFNYYALGEAVERIVKREQRKFKKDTK